MKQQPFEPAEIVLMKRDELIFYKINGIIDSDAVLEIPDETEPGGKLEWYIEQIYEARKQLCAKNNISFEYDPNLESIINAYEALCRKCGLLMYKYGFQDGKEHG